MQDITHICLFKGKSNEIFLWGKTNCSLKTSTFYSNLGSYFKSSNIIIKSVRQIKKNPKNWQFFCTGKRKSCGGVWQAVSLCKLLAYGSVEICIWLKGGLKHQSLSDAPLDAAQRDRWRKTSRHKKALNYCTQNALVPKIKVGHISALTETTKCHTVLEQKQRQRLCFYITTLSKHWYFCIFALWNFV